MPADLRIAQFVTDPLRPEAMAPLRFMVECANVGDEDAGPFTVRFELNEAETIEVPVDNVASQWSEWVNWPHDGMTAGDHHIYCLLDAADAVPEPESQRNQQSLYFKVYEIEFAPQDADGDTDYDDEQLANAVIGTIMDRVNRGFTYSVSAVTEWGIEARTRVAAEYGDADATVDPAPVVAAFAQAVVKYLPGMSTALGIMNDVQGFIGLVQGYMGNAPMGLAGARARLNDAIDKIQVATGKATRQAIDDYESRVRAWLTPENNDSPLHQVEYGSLEPGYVAVLADWLGVSEPSEANTTDAIKQEMTAGFERVMADVNRQLWEEVS
jgi:hypothetical protein